MFVDRIQVTSRRVSRLLFMGSLFSERYETLEKRVDEPAGTLEKTSAGSVEHNDWKRLRDQFSAEHTQPIRPAADMANEALTQLQSDEQVTPTSTGHELDAFLGKAFEEKPVWRTLYDNVRDAFFPVKLPPLQLTSTPIPVPDRMAVKRNPVAIGISTSVNVLILGFAIWLGIKTVVKIVKPPVQAVNVDVGNFDLKAPKAADSAGGGGGGGAHDLVDPTKGKLPDRIKNPITPPQVPVLDKPKLEIPSAINVQPDIKLPDNPSMPNIGMTTAANVTLANGQGGGSGMGT